MQAGFALRLSMITLTILPARMMAHDAATLDAMPSQHGGQVRMAGPYHIELLLERVSVKGNRHIAIYLQNHLLQVLPSAGTSAQVKLTDGSRSTSVALTPDGLESLGGSVSCSSSAALVAVVLLRARDGQIYSATFNPFARREARPRDH
jgi:hypothetical protein